VLLQSLAYLFKILAVCSEQELFAIPSPTTTATAMEQLATAIAIGTCRHCRSSVRSSVKNGWSRETQSQTWTSFPWRRRLVLSAGIASLDRGAYTKVYFSQATNGAGGDKGDVHSFLGKELGIDSSLHDDLLKTISSCRGDETPSLDDLQSLGKDIILALAETVQQEVSNDTALELQWRVGDSLLDLVKKNEESVKNIQDNRTLIMEGACGGNMSCSTCHVYISQPAFQNFLEDPSEEERDMIDLAFEPRATSRLGCQIRLTPAVAGSLTSGQQLEFEIPFGVNNLWDPKD
jgi:ferredoxin